MKLLMLRTKILVVITLLMTPLLFSQLINPEPVSALSGSSFKADRIIDDGKFFRQPSLSVTAIQNFLNQEMPNCDTNGTQASGRSGYPTRADWGRANGAAPPYICLKDYRSNIVAKSAESGLCNYINAKTNVSAAQIIYDVSARCNIDAKVLLVLLQKEQGLVSDPWPWPSQYRIATGYGCPDTAPCDTQYYGFFNQVYNAARQFNNYRKNSSVFNYAAGRRSFVAYQANAPNCGGTNLTILNAATAALYNYTPYQPNAAALANLYGTGDACSAYGNRNFWRMYNDWFGPSISGSCIDGVNAVGATNGRAVIDNTGSVSLVMLNNTGSQCAEVHTWAPGYKSWSSNIATHAGSSDPENKSVISADMNGDGKDELHYVKYQSGSGRVEIHTWRSDFKGWSSNVATNLGNVDPATGTILAADTNGDGKDELHYVKYQSGSGRVEIHTWRSDFKGWSSNVATNQGSINTSFGRIIAADTDGNGKDEFHYVKYQSTGSGNVEIHTWAPGNRAWAAHRSTNVGQFSPETREVITGNTIGDKRDELMYVRYLGTASGKVEIHTWAPGFKSWASNAATNVSTFDPTE